MTNEIVYPFNGKVGVVLNTNASQAILKIGFHDGTLQIGLKPDQIDVLIRQLENVSAAAEDQRRRTDPFAGRDGDMGSKNVQSERQKVLRGWLSLFIEMDLPAHIFWTMLRVRTSLSAS